MGKNYRTWNPDVPPEAVITWLCKERDKAKDDLEKLIGYTKGLETRIMEMEADANIKREEYAKAIEKATKHANITKDELDAKKARRRKKAIANLHRLQEEARQLELQIQEVL